MSRPLSSHTVRRQIEDAFWHRAGYSQTTSLSDFGRLLDDYAAAILREQKRPERAVALAVDPSWSTPDTRHAMTPPAVPQPTPAALAALDYDKLEALAKAATPGRWDAGVILDNGIAQVSGDSYAVTTDRKPSAPGKIRVVALTGPAKSGVLDTQSEADAVYLAACSPDVILALLAAARRGAGDTERIDWLEAHPTASLNPDEDGITVSTWSCINDRQYRDHGAGRTVRQALDAARAAHPEGPQHETR